MESKSNKTYLVIGIIISLLVIGGVALSSYTASTPTTTNLESTLTDSSAKISFVPGQIQLAKGASSTVQLQLDANAHSIAGLTLELSYNPQEVKITKITNGTVLPNTLSSAKINAGNASISIATAPDSSGFNQTGNLVSLEVTSLTGQKSSIAIDPSTMLVALDQDGNMLTQFNKLQIN